MYDETRWKWVKHTQTHTHTTYSACDLACWSTTTPACYHTVAWGSFCFMRSSQEIPTPDWVCMSVFQTCCYPTECVSASRHAANKRGGAGAAWGRDKTTAAARSVYVCNCVSQYRWPLSAEKQKVRMCAHATPLASQREVSMCVFIKCDHVSPPLLNRRLRLVHVPPTEGSNSSRADASSLSGATIKNKQEVDGQGEGPMRVGFNCAAISTAHTL